MADIEYSLNPFYFRCVTDSTTHILTQGLHETKFFFNAFEFQNSKGSVYVECNATFCNRLETSTGCSQTCHIKRFASELPASTFTRNGRSPEIHIKESELGIVHCNLCFISVQCFCCSFLPSYS